MRFDASTLVGIGLVACLALGAFLAGKASRRPVAPAPQTIDCVDRQACLPSYNNTAACEKLAVGVSERELTFRLGQPKLRAGTVLFFEAGATEHGPIEVELDAHKNAIRISCRPIP